MSSLTRNPAPTELADIAAQEQRITLPSFSADVAWQLGCLLRERLLAVSQAPAVISISAANSSHLLFHCATRAGTTPDNDTWVARKRNTVLRFGASTWYMRNKFGADEAKFERQYGLAGRTDEYAIHGGGVPIRVKGVDGVVGVIIVSGLANYDDHQIVVETLEDYIKSLA